MIETVQGLAFGRYVAGDSLLHRCDPRLKLLLLPPLMAATFSAGAPRLTLLTLLLLVLIRLATFPLRRCWSTLRALRWLLLFSLLLHLLFTPGRTLFGTTWLSLDGLHFGLLVCWRLVAALLFASLLTQTTPPGKVAAALSWLLRPLGRLGVAPEKISEFLFLTLYFFPILEEETRSLALSEGRKLAGGKLLQRCQAAGRLLEPLAVALFDRADRLAHQSARGEPIAPRVELGPFCATNQERLSGSVLVLFLLLIWTW